MVTGASRGIGRAIAVALGAAGATVALIGRDAHALTETARQFPNGASFPVVADLADDGAIEDVAGSAFASLSGLDILVHAAGVIHVGPLGATAAEDLDSQYRVNLRAPVLLTRRLVGTLTERHGQVVFINSSAGLAAREGVAAYAATKHGLRAIADALRAELNPAGVRVVSVFLGRTATPMQERLYRDEGRVFEPWTLIQPEDVAGVVVHLLGLPRTVEVTDISLRPLRKPA